MRKLLFALIPICLLFAACSTNNVTVDDSLQRFFDSAGVKGTFALFDNGQGHFTITNLPRYRDSAYPPGATFDILESLIAFQTGVVKDDKTVVLDSDPVADDSAQAGQQTAIKQHFTLTQAFQTTGMLNTIVFQKLTLSTIGADTLRAWVDSLRYGNKALDGDSLALYNGKLRIVPDEQLGLIKKLYFGQLPFYRRSQELVRDMMKKEENSNYKLIYKVGRVLDIVPTDSTRKDWKGHVMGWVLGWVEENKHPYFYVLNFDDPNYRANVDTVGLQLVKHILASQGFFQGTK